MASMEKKFKKALKGQGVSDQQISALEAQGVETLDQLKARKVADLITAFDDNDDLAVKIFNWAKGGGVQPTVTQQSAAPTGDPSAQLLQVVAGTLQQVIGYPDVFSALSAFAANPANMGAKQALEGFLKGQALLVEVDSKPGVIDVTASQERIAEFDRYGSVDDLHADGRRGKTMAEILRISAMADPFSGLRLNTAGAVVGLSSYTWTGLGEINPENPVLQLAAFAANEGLIGDPVRAVNDLHVLFRDRKLLKRFSLGQSANELRNLFRGTVWANVITAFERDRDNQSVQFRAAQTRLIYTAQGGGSGRPFNDNTIRQERVDGGATGVHLGQGHRPTPIHQDIVTGERTVGVRVSGDSPIGDPNGWPRHR